MKIRYQLNNYTVGAKLKSAPLDCLVSQDRISKSMTVVVFDLNDRQRQFCDKLFAKRGQEI